MLLDLVSLQVLATLNEKTCSWVEGVASSSAPSEYRFGLFSETFLERISYTWLQNNKEEFMSITTELWQVIKVPFTEVKYGHL